MYETWWVCNDLYTRWVEKSAISIVPGSVRKIASLWFDQNLRTLLRVGVVWGHIKKDICDVIGDVIVERISYRDNEKKIFECRNFKWFLNSLIIYEYFVHWIYDNTLRGL